MDLEINKGIGRNVEFKGLESQYLFIFCGGLLAVFVVFVILYMAGVNQWVCIGFGVVAATLLGVGFVGLLYTFRLTQRRVRLERRAKERQEKKKSRRQKR